MSDNLETELLKALDDTTYDDLIDDLERYGAMPSIEGRQKYPILTIDLVKAAIDASDECPGCLTRFLRSGAKHSKGCLLAPLL